MSIGMENALKNRLVENNPAVLTPISSVFDHNGELSATSSSNTECIDILPSFQMYQSILKRNDSQFAENLSVSPPNYEQKQTNLSINNVNHDVSEEHTVLDNLDHLKKLPFSPLDIQIYVTKRVPVPHMQNDIETRLKEYQPGDLVNGYIIIHNKSSKPIDFGLFIVSLEGTIKRTASSENNSQGSMKKFLRMYDLNASYGYCCVPNAAGIQYEPYTKDKTDQCQLGLPNERILQPFEKYKKFFTFKFPNELLDSTCIHDNRDHCLPPPTYGFDGSCFGGRGEEVVLNKALGYGFVNSRGTPLLTLDDSFEDVSISYTIEARFIDKKQTKSNEDIYVISNESSYHLRFISQLNEESIPFAFEGETLDNIEYFQKQVEKEIESKVVSDSKSSQQLKQSQLLFDSNLRDLKQVRDISSTVTTSISVHSRKKLMFQSEKIGTLLLQAHIPSKKLCFISPALIRKNNPVSTEKCNTLEELSLDLEYCPFKGSKPPAITDIDIKLVSFSFKSSSPLPSILRWDLLSNTAELAKVQRQSSDYLSFLKANDIRIRERTFNSIKAFVSLKVKETEINLFKNVTSVSPAWKPRQFENNKLKYLASITVAWRANEFSVESVIPSFQTCLVGRVYCLKVYMSINGNDKKAYHILIPVNIG